MSSWISHLPEETAYAHVAGLGMNQEELEANERLDERCVQNLNENPRLPYAAGSFDRVMIVVSVQYLTRPVDVMRSILEVLDEGGELCIAMSHRLFPTKAVAAFQQALAETEGPTRRLLEAKMARAAMMGGDPTVLSLPTDMPTTPWPSYVPTKAPSASSELPCGIDASRATSMSSGYVLASTSGL